MGSSHSVRCRIPEKLLLSFDPLAGHRHTDRHLRTARPKRCGVDVLWPAIVALASAARLATPSPIGSGYYYKDGIQEVWPFKRNPTVVERGQVFFNKWGALSVFFGHFFGPAIRNGAQGLT